MVEGFLLGRIALERGHVPPWDAKFTAIIEPHLADTAVGGKDDAPMAAGDAAQLPIPETLVQRSFRRVRIEKRGQIHVGNRHQPPPDPL
jgi:hypothetical protein